MAKVDIDRGDLDQVRDVWVGELGAEHGRQHDLETRAAGIEALEIEGSGHGGAALQLQQVALLGEGTSARRDTATGRRHVILWRPVRSILALRSAVVIGSRRGKLPARVYSNTGVYCWGTDAHGEIGDAGAAGSSATPIRVPGFAMGAERQSCRRECMTTRVLALPPTSACEQLGDPHLRRDRRELLVVEFLVVRVEELRDQLPHRDRHEGRSCTVCSKKQGLEVSQARRFCSPRSEAWIACAREPADRAQLASRALAIRVTSASWCGVPSSVRNTRLGQPQSHHPIPVTGMTARSRACASKSRLKFAGGIAS